MRSKLAIVNAKYNFIFTITNLCLGFFSRAIFIRYLGGEILGLNSVIMSIMGVLNLVELGVGTAISISLYKPLSENDTQKIKEIISIFRYLYNKIAIIITIIGVIFIPFISLIDTSISSYKVIIIYIIILFNTVIGYFFAHKRTLLIADQRGYIVSVVTGITRIIKEITQIILLIIFKNYFVWLLINVIFEVTSMIFISRKSKKIYPYIDNNEDKSKKQLLQENEVIINQIKLMFYHKLAAVIVYKTDPIVIALYCTLYENAKYANYIMVINGVMLVIGSVLDALMPSIGNIVNKDKSSKVYSVFKELCSITNYISVVVCFTLYKGINDFIQIWVGEEYKFNTLIVILLVINLYIQINRITIDNFKNAYGILWDKYAPVIEGGINLICSVLLAKHYGIIGVVLGTVISNILIIVLWKPYVVMKYGIKRKPIKFFVMQLKYSVFTFIAILFSQGIVNNININILNNFINLIINMAINFSVISIVYFVLIYVFFREFRLFIKKILKVII